MELRFERLKRFMRLKLLFVILLIASNLIILPLYYRAEKQDFRGLVTYLKEQLREKDKIFLADMVYFPGILHYFGVYPETRHYLVPFWKLSGDITHGKSFLYRGQKFTIYHSRTCCTQYVSDGSRLWIVVGKWDAKRLKKNTIGILKGYFDGSFLNYNRFPTDVSMYLFLWDPQSPGEKGIDMEIE